MSNNLQGLFWAILATALFTAATAMAKLVAQDGYHVLQILLFRQVVIMLTVLPNVLFKFPQILKTKYPIWHAGRLIGAFSALSLGLLAISNLPLTTATTLGYANILFVTILAPLLLSESLGPYRGSMLVLGFVGVVVVIRPDIAGFTNIYMLAALGGAFGAATAAICVRKLSQTESTATLLTYQALFIGFLSGMPMIWLWKSPDLQALILLLAMGCLSATAQWLGVKALRLGEATLVKSADYISLLFASVFGFVFFAEVPDRFTLIGAGIIVLSALMIVRREIKKRRELASSSDLTGTTQAIR